MAGIPGWYFGKRKFKGKTISVSGNVSTLQELLHLLRTSLVPGPSYLGHWGFFKGLPMGFTILGVYQGGNFFGVVSLSNSQWGFPPLHVFCIHMLRNCSVKDLFPRRTCYRGQQSFGRENIYCVGCTREHFGMGRRCLYLESGGVYMCSQRGGGYKSTARV